jgi:hypothetical protein
VVEDRLKRSEEKLGSCLCHSEIVGSKVMQGWGFEEFLVCWVSGG